jgi:hypothetical protein
MSIWVGGRLGQSTVPRGAQSKPGGDADHRPWCRSGHVGCRTSLGRCVHGRRLMRAPVPFVALVDLAGGLLPNVDLCVIDQSQALRGPGQYRAARLQNRRHPGSVDGTALDDALKLARAGSRPRGEFLVSGSQMEASRLFAATGGIDAGEGQQVHHVELSGAVARRQGGSPFRLAVEV